MSQRKPFRLPPVPKDSFEVPAEIRAECGNPAFDRLPQPKVIELGGKPKIRVNSSAHAFALAGDLIVEGVQDPDDRIVGAEEQPEATGLGSGPQG